MNRHLSRLVGHKLRQAEEAAALLTATLRDADLELPSLTVDWHPERITGTVLVELGRAPAPVVAEMAVLIREGLTARAQQRS